MKLIAFLAVVACIAGTAAMLITIPLWLDRVIVFLLRTGRLYLYPTAIRLALSLETQEDDWLLDDNRLVHPTIGTVLLVTDRTLQVKLPNTNQSKSQTWTPSWIEKRIIWNAANSLIQRRRVSQLNRTLPPLPM